MPERLRLTGMANQGHSWRALSRGAVGAERSELALDTGRQLWLHPVAQFGRLTLSRFGPPREMKCDTTPAVSYTTSWDTIDESRCIPAGGIGNTGLKETIEIMNGAFDSRSSVDPAGSMEFIDLQWLLDHHEAKAKYRREMVDALSLRPGDIVLDVGCGPGLWSELIAEKVWPTGRVVGLDLSAQLIRYARRRQTESRYRDIMEFHEGSFYDLPFPDNSFSAVFFGNCFSYVTDPERVLAEQKRVTCSGGKIAVKDFDGGFILFHPVDHELSCRVLGAAARRLKKYPLNPAFDNYVGRKLDGLIKQANLVEVKTISYAIQLVSPLSGASKRYITGNAQWYCETAKPFLSQDDVDAWSGYFDRDSDRYILDRPDFYFCMLEVLCIGTVAHDLNKATRPMAASHDRDPRRSL